MSFERIQDCAKVSIASPAKGVLIAIAYHQNREHDQSWPSITVLAEFTGCSERTVRRAITTLESEGVLSVDRSNGRHSKYKILLPYLHGINPGQSDLGGGNPGHSDPGQRVRATPVTVTPRSDRPRSESPGTPVSVTGDPGQSDRGPRSESPPNRKEPERTVIEPQHGGATPRTERPGSESPGSAVTESRVAQVCRLMKVQLGHSMQFQICQVIADDGVDNETIIAACDEAKRIKPNERIGAGYVHAILKGWAATRTDAAGQTAGAQRPVNAGPGGRGPTRTEQTAADIAAAHRRNSEMFERHDAAVASGELLDTGPGGPGIPALEFGDSDSDLG